MPNINLVAARREEKRTLTTLSRQLFMGFVASGVLLGAAIIWFIGVSFSEGQQVKSLDAKLTELEPKLEQIKKREGEIAAMKPKVDTLDNARLSTLRWRTFLGVLANATPTTVYYTSVATGGEGDSQSVTLKGVAPSQDIVGTVSQNLNARGNSMFEDVEITQTTNGSVPEDPVQKVVFDMVLYLRPVALASTEPSPAPSPLPAPAPSP